MLLICNESELVAMRLQCDDCSNCVFKFVECPIENNMIMTPEQIQHGKELSVNLQNIRR